MKFIEDSCLIAQAQCLTNCISEINIVQTVQLPVGDHPKYEDLVVAYDNRAARIFLQIREFSSWNS